MTTHDQLQRIKNRCQELLATAEKRTQGRWKHRHGEMCSHWVSRADELSNICEINTSSPYTSTETSQNAAFIASCAGPAEAGWKATIAAIDIIESLPHKKSCMTQHNYFSEQRRIEQEKVGCDCSRKDSELAIINAWREELV